MATRTANGVAIGAGVAVWTPDGTNRVVVSGVTLSLSVAGSAAFKDGATGAELLRTPVLTTNAAYTILGSGTVGLFSGSPGTAVVLVGPAGATVTGTLWGGEESTG